ncbi:MAG: DUF423 domain-containing protein [Pirellulales bacterium]
MYGRFWIAVAAVLASAGVAAGAIGTHVLKESLKLPASELETYDIAVRYQVYHSLGMAIVGLLSARLTSRWLTASGTLMLLGAVLFSGGIYAWLATGQTPFIHVVPIGGSAWILAWLLLALGALFGTPRDSGDST